MMKAHQSRNIRVIYLVGQLGLGGSERQLYQLLTHLDGGEFERHVIVFNPSPHLVLDDALRQAGVQVWNLPAAARSIEKRLWYLNRLFRRLKPQVVHSWTVHDNPYAGIGGLLAGVPLRLGSLRGSLELPWFRKLSPVLRWLSLHSVSGIVVNTPALGVELEHRGIGKQRIFCLPNGVEPALTNLPAADLSALGIPAEARVVGTVGNLRANKNHALFIRALGRILPDFPDAYGLIVGQAIPEEQGLVGELERLIEEIGMAGRIRLAGFRADVPAILKRLSVFCLTSEHEGMPNAILEAMAAGLPILATQVGGVPEIIQDGINGLLVQPGDETGVAGGIRRLLNDGELAMRIGAAGRQYAAKEHDFLVISRKLSDYYRQCLDRNT